MMSELAAGNSFERAQALLQLTERLTSLIERETALFRARKPQDALSFQDEKSRLANVYRVEIAKAGREPHRLAGIPAALKDALRRATQAFHKALAENGSVLKGLRAVTEGMVKSIATEANRQRNQTGTYGPGATQAASTGRPLAVAVNQSA